MNGTPPPDDRTRTLIVRVWLPDRPGALGQVASRIGAVRGDVVGIDILETGEGRVVDELVITLPAIVSTRQLVAEVSDVDGVSVEDVRDVDPDRADRTTLALEVAASVAEAAADDRLGALCRGLAVACDADWVAVLRDGAIVEAVGTPPEPSWLHAFLLGSAHLSDAGSWDATGELLQVRLSAAGVGIAAGRADRPFHTVERKRAAIIARIADAVIGAPAVTG